MLGLLDIVAFSMEERMNYYLRSSYELVTWFGQHVTLHGYVVYVCVYMFFSYSFVCVCVCGAHMYVDHFQLFCSLGIQMRRCS